MNTLNILKPIEVAGDLSKIDFRGRPRPSRCITRARLLQQLYPSIDRLFPSRIYSHHDQSNQKAMGKIGLLLYPLVTKDGILIIRIEESVYINPKNP